MSEVKNNQLLIPFDEMKREFIRVLLKYGFTEERADRCAEIYTANSLDGVYTHGVNRFARFIKYIDEKCIDVCAEPELIHSTGSLEQWNGNLGPGVLNAYSSTERSMKLADDFGIGCVALANTNHWMRGGYYGWQAAKCGYAFIGWTNTLGLMPAWGAINSKLGNNPLVFGMPYNGEAIVLDFAMSQFSYGKMEMAQMRNEQLPYDGGFNKNRELTKDPNEILETKRSLQIGLWKGAGLALLLDIFATILSGGIPTYEISKYQYEHSLSQVFITINLSKLSNSSIIADTLNSIISDYHESIKEYPETEILYPGERVLKTRKRNLKKGIPVDKIIWDEIINL